MSAQPRQGPPLLLPAFPGAALLLGSPDAPGGQLLVKLTPEGVQEPGRAQAILLAGAPAGWVPPPRRDGGPPLRLQLAAGIRTVLLSKAGEQPGPRAPPVPGPPPSDPAASCTSKGVYENYRRWQRYKGLARRHCPGTPDAEALACFFIPVLRSLGRLRPALAPEEGVPRAVQEWERSSNFERMIFYEMAEKFMEFEAEEELQIQKMKLLSSSRFQPPAAEPPKPPGPPAPDQQQVYIPKKAASKGRQPRRRQRRPPGPPAPGEPREIPPEAVRQYAEIMEGLRPGWEEEAGGRGEPQSQAQGALPDPGLLRYLERLCEDESFVCKVEAVIHPQFLAQLLSPEKRRDLLDLSEELEGELGLTPSQLVEKRLLALSEEELSPPACPAPQSDSTPSQSDEEDEGGGQKGSAGRRQAVSGASPPGGGGAKGRAPGAEPPEGPSQSRPRQPAAGALKNAAAPRGPSPRQRGGQGRRVASLRSRVERASQQPPGQGQDGGRREESAGTAQPGSRAWGLRSQGDNLVGPANLESPPSGCRIEDGGQQGTVKGRREASVGGEGLGDAPMGAECNCQGDKAVEQRPLESTLNGQGKQDGCQGEKVKGQSQAGWEALGDVPKALGYAKVVRSPRDNLVEQRALESTLNGHGKQDGCQGEKVKGQSQAGWEALGDIPKALGYAKVVRSPRDNLVEQRALESTLNGHGKQDGCQGEKVKGQTQAGWEALGDVPRAPGQAKIVRSPRDNPVEQRALESTLNGHGKQDGGQGEKVKGQPQAGWESLGDVPKAPGQAKVVRSGRDNPVEQRALESTLNGHGKQDGCQEEKVRGQNQIEADWKKAAPRLCDLQPGRMKSSGNNLKGKGSPAATPTGPGEQDGSRAGQPTKLEPSVGAAHPPVSLLRGANGWPLGLSTHPLGADGRGEGEWPPGSDVHGPRPDPKGPTEARAESEAESGHRAEPGGSRAMAKGSPRPRLQDGGTLAGPGDPRATRGRGNTTTSWDGGNEAGEAGPAVGDGSSKMATVTRVRGDREDAGKRGADEDDEELSVFSSLLASKLRLSSPGGPVGTVPTPWDQGGPHGRAPSPSWGPARWDATRRCSPRPGPGLDGSHPADPGVRRSHKRRSDKMATRRSKRLRSQ